MFVQIFGLVFLYYGFYYFVNLRKAKATKLPYISIPLIVQDSILWSITGPTARAWFRRNLPTRIYDRLVLSIYGFEFFGGQRTYDIWINPQVQSNQNLIGGGKTYATVTSGCFEINTYDPEIAQQILARPKDFRQNEMASFVVSRFGNNVLTTDGADWVRHRRVVAGAVTERVSSVVWLESLRQTEGLIRTVTSGTGTTNKLFDFVKTITIHVLYAAGMGDRQDFDAAVDSEEPLKPGRTMTYIDAVKMVNEYIAGPIVIPTRLLLSWPRWLPGYEQLQKLGRAKVEFPLYTSELLEAEKKRAASSSETRNNIMSALIAASERGDIDPEKADKDMKKGPALSREELVGNMYIFTAAGFDTTANTIAYALMFLTQNPKWQEWIFEELDQVVSPDTEVVPDYTAVFPKMTRILAVLFETLRLFPAVLHITKQASGRQTITTSKLELNIPSKCIVYVNSIALHREPTLWRDLNSSDDDRKLRISRDVSRPDEVIFRPSRWINGASAQNVHFQPPKGTYVPWSGGPRVCPGQKMAQVEFTGILLPLLRNHRIEVVKREGEDEEALQERLESVMQGSQPKLTMEMDVFNIQAGEDRGVSFRFVKRR